MKSARATSAAWLGSFSVPATLLTAQAPAPDVDHHVLTLGVAGAARTARQRRPQRALIRQRVNSAEDEPSDRRARIERMNVAAARALSEGHIEPFSERRWRHVESVVELVRTLCTGLPDEDRALVEAAAWLHDLGYAPSASVVGFHPLDGARYLRAEGWPEDLCNLVAHHSCADLEADRRGFGDELRAEFPNTPGPVRDVLWAADATTGPGGERLTVDERVREVVRRYGAGSLVADCMVAIAPQLAAALGRVEARLSQDAVQPT